jgi:hypothetical protein
VSTLRAKRVNAARVERSLGDRYGELRHKRPRDGIVRVASLDIPVFHQKAIDAAPRTTANRFELSSASATFSSSTASISSPWMPVTCHHALTSLPSRKIAAPSEGHRVDAFTRL